MTSSAAYAYPRAEGVAVQPRASATSRRTRICSTSITRIASAFPASRLRGSGLAPRRVEHAVPALEAGRDGEPNEGCRHHGKADDAGKQEVDAATTDVEQRNGRPENQQSDRNDEHKQELLAIAQERPQLYSSLRPDHP